MAEFINVINDISTPVKFGWLAVVAWGVVQFVWYQRGRVDPAELDAPAETETEGWSLARLLARFRRDDADESALANSGSLSIAPTSFDDRHAEAAQDGALGEAAGIALENLLNDQGHAVIEDYGDATVPHGDAHDHPSHQSSIQGFSLRDANRA
jgi:hypothetical protein